MCSVRLWGLQKYYKILYYIQRFYSQGEEKMINIHKTKRQYDGTECNSVLYYVVQTWKLNCFKVLTILSLIYINTQQLTKSL